MLKVENITKYYGDFLAVDNLSFTVKQGEIFGLLGVIQCILYYFKN